MSRELGTSTSGMIAEEDQVKGQLPNSTGISDSETAESLGSQIPAFSDIIPLSKLFAVPEITQLKLVFVSSVLAQFFTVWAVAAGRAILPWYYVWTMPLLYTWRVYTYTKKQWHYFCLDFCYFANFAIFLVLLLAPSNPELFIVQFCIGGLLNLSAIVFRNPLLFHSVDKMSSTFFHGTPGLVVFCIRWYPEETSEFWHTAFPQTFLPWNLKWNVLAPIAFFSAHTIFYTVLVYGILKPDEQCKTLFRFMKEKESIKAVLGSNAKITYFLLGQFGIVFALTFVTKLTYTYFYLHLLQVLLGVVVATWNGAHFYVDVFRKCLLYKTKKS